MNTDSPKIFNTVYMTVNLLNNKIYVGVHQTPNPNDDYLGSGTHLIKAIKKYGCINFEKSILYECVSINEAYLIEGLIVNEEFIKRPNVYNCCVGGISGCGYSNKGIKRTKEFKEKIKAPKSIRRPIFLIFIKGIITINFSSNCFKF